MLKILGFLQQWRSMANKFVTFSWIWNYIFTKIVLLRIRYTMGHSARKKLISWLSSTVPKCYLVKGFPSCLQDGIVLCALVEKLSSGACPRFDVLDPAQKVRNLKLAFHLLEKHIQIKPEVSVDEVLEGGKTCEGKLLLLLAQIKMASKSLPPMPNHKLLASESNYNPRSSCLARGMGLMLAVKGRRASFSILVDSNDDLDMVIEIRGPNNTACSKRLTTVVPSAPKIASADDPIQQEIMRKKIPMSYKIQGPKISVCYSPLESGSHCLNVIWQGRHIMGSPYIIKVDKSMEFSDADIWCSRHSRHDSTPNRSRSLCHLDSWTKSSDFTENPVPEQKNRRTVRKKVICYIVKVGEKDVVVKEPNQLGLLVHNLRNQSNSENRLENCKPIPATDSEIEIPNSQQAFSKQIQNFPITDESETTTKGSVNSSEDELLRNLTKQNIGDIDGKRKSDTTELRAVTLRKLYQASRNNSTFTSLDKEDCLQNEDSALANFEEEIGEGSMTNQKPADIKLDEFKKNNFKFNNEAISADNCNQPGLIFNPESINSAHLKLNKISEENATYNSNRVSDSASANTRTLVQSGSFQTNLMNAFETMDRTYLKNEVVLPYIKNIIEIADSLISHMNLKGFQSDLVSQKFISLVQSMKAKVFTEKNICNENNLIDSEKARSNLSKYTEVLNDNAINSTAFKEEEKFGSSYKRFSTKKSLSNPVMDETSYLKPTVPSDVRQKSFSNTESYMDEISSRALLVSKSSLNRTNSDKWKCTFVPSVEEDICVTQSKDFEFAHDANGYQQNIENDLFECDHSLDFFEDDVDYEICESFELESKRFDKYSLSGDNFSKFIPRILSSDRLEQSGEINIYGISDLDTKQECISFPLNQTSTMLLTSEEGGPITDNRIQGGNSIPEETDTNIDFPIHDSKSVLHKNIFKFNTEQNSSSYVSGSYTSRPFISDLASLSCIYENSIEGSFDLLEDPKNQCEALTSQLHETQSINLNVYNSVDNNFADIPLLQNELKKEIPNDMMPSVCSIDIPGTSNEENECNLTSLEDYFQTNLLNSVPCQKESKKTLNILYKPDETSLQEMHKCPSDSHDTDATGACEETCSSSYLEWTQHGTATTYFSDSEYQIDVENLKSSENELSRDGAKSVGLRNTKMLNNRTSDEKFDEQVNTTGTCSLDSNLNEKCLGCSAETPLSHFEYPEKSYECLSAKKVNEFSRSENEEPFDVRLCPQETTNKMYQASEISPSFEYSTDSKILSSPLCTTRKNECCSVFNFSIRDKVKLFENESENQSTKNSKE